MKFMLQLLSLVVFTMNVQAQVSNGTEEEMKSLGKQITALNEAFTKGDAAAVASNSSAAY